MQKRFTLHILFLLLLMAGNGLYAQEAMYLSLDESYHQTMQEQEITQFVKFFEDPGGKLNYADVLLSYAQGEFYALDQMDSLYSHELKSTWWMAVPLKSNAQAWKEYWFNAGGEFLVWDSLHVYTLDAAKKIQEQKTGRALPRSEWEAPLHPNYFSVRLNPGDSCLLILSMKNEVRASLTPEQLYFQAVDYPTQIQDNLKERFTVGLFLGILSIQLLFFFLFFIITRDATFGYFVLYILGLTGVVFFTAQTEFHLLRLNLSMAFIISAAFVLCAIIGLLRFSQSYLSIKEHLPGWGAPARWYERFIIVLTLFLMFAIGTYVTTGDTSLSTEDGAMSVLFILGILLYILMFVILGICLLYWGVHTMRKGFRPAKFYLMGNSVFILGVLLY
ncbi:MAG: 7TM diverse intracellular signaling domain-containing protein, partial [Bacteroidota bacterium]